MQDNLILNSWLGFFGLRRDLRIVHNFNILHYITLQYNSIQNKNIKKRLFENIILYRIPF